MDHPEELNFLEDDDRRPASVGLIIKLLQTYGFELQDKVTGLSTDISDLEDKIKELENRLDALDNT